MKILLQNKDLFVTLKPIGLQLKKLMEFGTI